MKKVLLVLFWSILTVSYSFAENYNLTVKVTGIEGVEGQISIGLYNSEESYPLEDKVFKGGNVLVKGNIATYIFEQIPTGIYAIAILHDENMNGKMDKGLFGIPKEGYAFSNNVFGTFDSPKFDAVAFEIITDKTIEIKIKY